MSHTSAFALVFIVQLTFLTDFLSTRFLQSFLLFKCQNWSLLAVKSPFSNTVLMKTEFF